MKKIFSAIFLFVILSNIPLLANEKMLENELTKGKEYIYRFDVENGYPFFDSLIQVYPKKPIPYFYKGYFQLLIFSQDMTNEDLLKNMKGNFDRCIKLIKDREKYENFAHYNYYLGLSSGAIGIYYILDKNYFKGFIYGRRAKNYLEKTVKINENYYDAYLGLGIYHYYVGLMSGIKKFFAGLFGFSG
ncbi:MAG: hypothetical protein KAR38_12930, partial [Calditrichia bacterium]|nr:hypothetical protein [Calditrichia bacterium]